jgi:hypothetical protein
VIFLLGNNPKFFLFFLSNLETEDGLKVFLIVEAGIQFVGSTSHSICSGFYSSMASTENYQGGGGGQIPECLLLYRV